MKLRSTLLSALVLLTGSLAGAATANSAAMLPLAAASAPVAVAPSAPISSACVQNASKAALALPVPFEPRSYAEICGSCSASVCRGAVQGVSCGLNARCLDVYGLICSADGLERCYCWKGPLP